MKDASNAISAEYFDRYDAPPRPKTFEEQLDVVLDGLRTMLVKKNKAYGNSALDPIRIFSKADPTEQLKTRIDDKLSRLMRGADCGEDTVMDLIGYLVLLRVAERRGK